jgi:hypothetical protein
VLSHQKALRIVGSSAPILLSARAAREKKAAAYAKLHNRPIGQASETVWRAQEPYFSARTVCEKEARCLCSSGLRTAFGESRATDGALKCAATKSKAKSKPDSARIFPQKKGAAKNRSALLPDRPQTASHQD